MTQIEQKNSIGRIQNSVDRRQKAEKPDVNYLAMSEA